jgi:beta-lactamase regulating signal transducer with metallopeptidase domain
MTEAFLDATLVTGLIAIALVLLRRPMLKLLGPEWTYAAWILPVLPAIPVRMPAMPSMDPGGVLSGSAGAVYTVTATFEREVASYMDIGQIALWIWALGAVSLFAWGISRYAYLLQLLRDAEQIDTYDGMPVQIAAVPVPMTVGVITPRIIVPGTLWEITDAPGRANILAHEAVHAKRRDVLWNLMGFGLLCLHWFNPAAWLAYRSMRRDQELSCDARVTGESSSDDRARYARLLVEVVAAQPVSAAPAMAADLERLEERIKMIWRHRTRPAVTRTALIAMIAAGAAMSGLRAGATDAVRFADEEALHEEGNNVTVDVIVTADDAALDGLHEVTVWVGDGDEAHADGNAPIRDDVEFGWSTESTTDVRVRADDDTTFEYAFRESPEAAAVVIDRMRGSSGHAFFGEGVMLDLSITRDGMTASPTMVIPFSAEGMIEMRDDGSSSGPMALALTIEDSSPGTAMVNWSVREQYADEWVDIASGQQFVTLGESTELVTGQPGTTILLTASQLEVHED